MWPLKKKETRSLKDLTNKELYDSLNTIEEEIKKREIKESKEQNIKEDEVNKMVETKPKIKIPFPTQNKKVEENNTITSKDQDEYRRQEEEQLAEDEAIKASTLTCKHEIDAAMFMRTQGAWLICGHCKRSIFINGSWIGFDREIGE